MKIAHYAPNLWTPGGISTYVNRMGAAQSRHGHEVTYLSRNDGEFEDRPNAIPVRSESELYSIALEGGFDVLHMHKSVMQSPPKHLAAVRTMHGHQGGCPSGTRYLKRQGTACDRKYTISGCMWGHVVDRCGSVRPAKLWSNFARIRREQRLAGEITTITVSDFLREQMIRGGCEAGNLLTVHSPAPDVDNSFQPVDKEATPRFVFLGRLVPQKGAAWVIRAMARLSHDAHLDIAGKGPMREQLQTLAGELGVSDRFTFHGWVTPASVENLLANSRAVVFPSLWHEPAGLVTLEAAAHGRPVIASKVGGIPEYARPEFATLVEPNDVTQLSQAIDELAADPELADRRGRIAIATTKQHFNMNTFIRRMDHIYDSAIRRTGELQTS